MPLLTLPSGHVPHVARPLHGRVPLIRIWLDVGACSGAGQSAERLQGQKFLLLAFMC